MSVLTERDEEYLASAFVYHSPRPGQPEIYQLLRDTFKELAREILTVCPSSRERSVALTQLETAMMWANASIAREKADGD